jgi:hypothetical protein
MTEMVIQKCSYLSMAPHGACKLKPRRVQNAVLARLLISRDFCNFLPNLLAEQFGSESCSIGLDSGPASLGY